MNFRRNKKLIDFPTKKRIFLNILIIILIGTSISYFLGMILVQFHFIFGFITAVFICYRCATIIEHDFILSMIERLLNDSDFELDFKLLENLKVQINKENKILESHIKIIDGIIKDVEKRTGRNITFE